MPPTQKGYLTSSVNENESNELGRASGTPLIVLRLLMHLLLQVAAAIGPKSRCAQVATLLHFQGDVHKAMRHLVLSVEKDWNTLLKRHAMDDTELALALHLVTRAMLSHRGGSPKAPIEDGSVDGVFKTHAARCVWELDFQADVVAPVFGSELQARLQAARNELQHVDPSVHLRAAMGDDLWNAISFDANASGPSTAAWIWAPPVDCSLALFEREFTLRASTASRHPVLAAIVRNRTLLFIQCIVDILQWHAVLFSALEGSGMRREEAGSISSREVIQNLREDRRAYAAAAMDAFCDAFNKSFHLVVNLFECQQNPFLWGPADARRIDLSLAGGANGEVLMSPDIPVSFSLPSVLPGQNEASSLCTVQLLNVLAEAHNAAMAQLARMDSPMKPPTSDVRPTISFQTPRPISEKLLLSFDPSRHLLPLLATLRTPNGAEAFDYGEIERRLVNDVLICASEVNVHVHHFSYRGELQRSGRLGRLKARVPQRPLPESFLNSIWDEVNTQLKLKALLAVLEQAATFLGAVGVSDGAQLAEEPLVRYVLGALQLPRESWAEASTPTIEQQVKLCHIQALLMALEEGEPGSSALDRVALAYRRPLEGELQARLASDVRLVVSEVLPALYDLMTQQLCEERWNPDSQLKQYLAFSSELDLESLEWYQQAFPEELALAHSFATYQVLKVRGDA